MADKSAELGDRAIAFCWLAHLIADATQPCNVGSLYAEHAFPKGDRGAREIKTQQRENLHAVWDQMLGNHFDEDDVQRRMWELRAPPWPTGPGAQQIPWVWIDQSRAFACRYVYTDEVLDPIRVVAEGKADKVPTLELSAEYMEGAAHCTHISVFMAVPRLATHWQIALRGDGDVFRRLEGDSRQLE